MGDAEKTEPFSSQSCTEVEQEAIKKTNICNSDYILMGKKIYHEGWLNTGGGAQIDDGISFLGGVPRPNWMWS